MPLRDRMTTYRQSLEDRAAKYTWPILDFDGKGMLVCGKSSLDIRNLSFSIEGIDLTFVVDEETKVLAKLDTINIRLGRDIKLGEMYFNIKGDGTPASSLKSFASSISRTASSTSISSNQVSNEESRLALQKGNLPPTSPVASQKDGSFADESDTSLPRPPALPPRNPPRKTQDDHATTDTLTKPEEITDMEQEHIDRALHASMSDPSTPMRSTDRTASTIGTPHSPTASIGTNMNQHTPRSVRASASSDTPGSIIAGDDHSLFFPESDEIDGAFSNAALDDSAIHHTSRTDAPEDNDFDIRAAIAASLEDQIPHRESRMRRIKLSEILARIPWWLRFSPGAHLTRLILSVVAWMHPITVTSIAATSTGKRITNLLETSGLKKAHPNQEIFRLIRKVFLWLEAGDISVILSTISIQPQIPIAADNDISVVLKAYEPTAYRNTSGIDEVLAKIDGIKASFKIPTYLLPNHEAYIPTTPRSSIPASILLSLPGVFNRELLTIGAAFLKATTMIDLRQTAQNRPHPTLPLNSGSQFSFKSFGLAVKQAAGDLAKQKGVQWGVRDAELAKWTAKFARVMGLVKVDIGTAFDIPVNLIKLRRKASLREVKRQADMKAS